MFEKTLCTHSPCSTQRHSAVQQLPAKTQIFALKTQWHSCATTQGEGASIIWSLNCCQQRLRQKEQATCVRTTEREECQDWGVGGPQEGELSSSSCSQRYWVTNNAWAAGRNLPEEARALSSPTFRLAVTSSSSSAGTVQSLGMWGRSKWDSQTCFLLASHRGKHGKETECETQSCCS